MIGAILCTEYPQNLEFAVGVIHSSKLTNVSATLAPSPYRHEVPDDRAKNEFSN